MLITGLLCSVALAGNETAGDLDAQFRGCDTTGWCQFWFELPGQTGAALHRVLPDGVRPGGDDVALRDRLNALLADMIHQHKQIRLHNLRRGEDGNLCATVKVTGVPLADDPILVQLRRKPAPVAR